MTFLRPIFRLQAHASVVYVNTAMGRHIAAYGWGDWGHDCGHAANCSADPSCWCRHVLYAESNSSGPGARPDARVRWSRYGTFRLNFHRFDWFELDLRGHTQPWGAAFSCLRLK